MLMPAGMLSVTLMLWPVSTCMGPWLRTVMFQLYGWPTTTGLRLDVLVMLRSTELSTLMVLVLLPGTLSV